MPSARAASNVGSRRVIEACGGVLESEVVEPTDGEVMCRYWLEREVAQV